MDYRELTEQEYYDRLRIVVAGAEGLHARSQDVGDGMATIGYGYTFNRGNNADIWRDSGIQLTPQEVTALEAIDAAPAANRTRLGLTFQRELTAAESEQLLRASMREYEGPANSLNMPLSEERVAMVSLTYNRGTGALMGNAARNIPEHPIMDAIRDGDRAEAWFQMRYNCWGSAGAQFEGGLYNAGLPRRKYSGFTTIQAMCRQKRRAVLLRCMACTGARSIGWNEPMGYRSTEIRLEGTESQKQIGTTPPSSASMGASRRSRTPWSRPVKRC